MADESTTAKLRSIDPWVAWLRTNVTPPVAVTLVGLIFSTGVVWANLTAKIASLERTVATLAVKIDALPTRDTSVAVLQEKVADLERQVEANNRKWERAESAADIQVVPHRRR